MKTYKMKKVLIALDYNPTAQKVADIGFAMAKAMSAEVVLLHVINDPTYYSSEAYSPIMGFTGFVDMDPLRVTNFEGLREAAKQFLEKSKQYLGDERIETVVGEGDLAETILLQAKKLKIDLIILGSHSRKWLENILIGSVTEKVLQHTHVPLFIVPTKKKS